MKDRLVFVAAVACGAAGLLAGHCARAENWITPGAVSYHFERTQGNGERWNETNYGLGLEHEFSPGVAVMAGVYRNSIDRWSKYAMLQWTPLALGQYVRAGVMVGTVDNYRMNGGDFIAAAAPVVTIEGARFGLNLSAVPKIRDKTSAAVAVQFKVRF